MQQKNSGFMDKVAGFVAGKGFYIILALCAAAIGVSGYVLFFTGNEEAMEEPLPIVNEEPSVTTPVALPEEDVQTRRRRKRRTRRRKRSPRKNSRPASRKKCL